MIRRILNKIRFNRIKPLSQIDNIDDLRKYEEWVNKKGCPAGKQGEPGIIIKGGLIK